jgi:hypothetical protein
MSETQRHHRGSGARGRGRNKILRSGYQFEGRSNEHINPVFCNMTPCILVQIISDFLESVGLPSFFREEDPLNVELNPTCYVLALLGAHHILHASRIGVKPLQVLSTFYEFYCTDFNTSIKFLP